MENIRNFLDTKRYLMLILPALSIIAVFVFSKELIKYLPFKIEKQNFEQIIKPLIPLLNVNIPESRRVFKENVFDYMYLIKGKSASVKPAQEKQAPPNYKILLIYIRDENKYVIINGKIYKEGSKISEQEYIVKIDKDGVLLNGYWGLRWIKY